MKLAKSAEEMIIKRFYEVERIHKVVWNNSLISDIGMIHKIPRANSGSTVALFHRNEIDAVGVLQIKP